MDVSGKLVARGIIPSRLNGNLANESCWYKIEIRSFRHVGPGRGGAYMFIDSLIRGIDLLLRTPLLTTESILLMLKSVSVVSASPKSTLSGMHTLKYPESVQPAPEPVA